MTETKWIPPSGRVIGAESEEFVGVIRDFWFQQDCKIDFSKRRNRLRLIERPSLGARILAAMRRWWAKIAGTAAGAP